MILIVCAMENEARVIRESIENIEICKLLPQKYYYKGTIKGKAVALIITGVGKVNAATLTSAILGKEKFEYIINIGYAGGVKPYKVGDIVVIKDASYHDVDLTSVNSLYEYGQVPNMPHPFLSEISLVRRIRRELKCHALSLYTGDKFMTEKFYEGAGVYDMEGAAVYQVAHIFQTPIVAIKVISDILDTKTQNVDYSKSEEEFARLIKNTLVNILKIKIGE